MAKVTEVDTNQVRKEDKAKHKPKKSNSKRPRTKKPGLKHANPQPLDPSPNGHVQGGVRVREATTNESPEQSQIDRKRQHILTSKSQTFEAIDSNFARIASYVQLAHEAVGRTVTTAYSKHLRRSINSGISAALKDAHFIGTSQPEHVTKQELCNKVLECINGRSPYTLIRRVLVALEVFVQALHVQVTAIQQSAADHTDLSPSEEQENGEEKDQNNEFGPGQVHYTRPQHSQVQLHKNATFSRDIVLMIWRPNVLVHLRAMNKEDFLSIVDSAFQRVSPHSDSSRALRWLSHATITDSGDVKVSMHSGDPNELETLPEDMISEWATILQNEAEQSSRVFEVLVPNFPVDPTGLEDPSPKAEIIDYPHLISSCTDHVKNLGSTISPPHSKEVLEEIRCLRQEVMALEEGLTSMLESRDQRSVSTGVSGKTLKSRSKVSGRIQQASAITELPAASNGKRKSHKRKAKEITTDNIQPEAAFDKKRVKR